METRDRKGESQREVPGRLLFERIKKKKRTSPATQPVQSGPQRWRTEEGTSPGEKRLLIYCNL